MVGEYEGGVCGPNLQLGGPGVIAPKDFSRRGRRRAFARFSVFLRDRFTCQYCEEPFPAPELTFDHIVPRSKGGRTTWENVVTACQSCNLIKGDRLPQQAHMYPRRRPMQPSSFQLQENGRAFPPNYLHQSWRDFLYWDTELDPS